MKRHSFAIQGVGLRSVRAIPSASRPRDAVADSHSHPIATLQRQAGNQAIQATFAAWSPVHEVLRSTGEPLNSSIRAPMESSFRHDFSRVRVHTGADGARAAEALNAHAYTVGHDIVFGAGEFNPGTPAGRQLLAHELTHVVQQSTARTAAQPVIMRWARDPQGRLTPAAVAELKQELLKRGIIEEQLGEIDAIADLGDDARVKMLLATLDRFIHEGGRLGSPIDKAKNYPGRIIASWNVNKDDLGYTNKRPGKHYKSILHYIAELERLAQASTGKDYISAATSSAIMPDLRLSGARMSGGGVGVHPRVVYFVAAGQVGIDEAAARAVDAADPSRKQAADTMRRAFGQGHFVPAGGFQWLLKDVLSLLTGLGYSTRPNPRARGKAKAGVERQEGLERGVQIYAVLRLEIDRMLLVLQGQEDEADVPSHEASAHREPQLRQYFLPRRTAIEAVVPPADDTDTPRAAREMLVALGNPTSLSFHHGAGSIDPHGTDHAIGLAIDYYNGRGDEGSYHNYTVLHWAFIHRLIQEHGDQYDIPTNLRPNSIHAVSPDIARAISTLTRDWGRDLADTVREEATAVEAEEKADPELGKERKKALTAFNHLRNNVAYQLARRRGAISRITEKQRGLFPSQVRVELASLAVDLKGFGNVIQQFSATEIISMLDGIDTRLDEMRKKVDEATATATAEATAAEESAEQDRLVREEEALAKEKGEFAGVQSQRDTEMRAIDQQIQEVEAALAATNLDAQARRQLSRERERLKSQRSKAVIKWRAAEKREERDTSKAASGFTAERSRAAAAAKKAATVRTAAALALTQVAPEPDTLEDLMGELQTVEAESEEAYGIELNRALSKEMRGGGFKRWLDLVSDPDRPIFDQPSVIVEGLNQVAAHSVPGGVTRGTHFFSGHHWTVAPREILDSTDTYRASLDRDMGLRNREQLRRILSVMAENEGGRAILFGATGDPIFNAALEERLKKSGTSSAEVLEEVRAATILPYKDAPGELGKLLRQLRDRGYYL